MANETSAKVDTLGPIL